MAVVPAEAVELAASHSPPANKADAPSAAQVVGERDTFFGTRVRKSFGARFFWGTIVGRYVVAGGAFYKVSFDDGDVDVFAANEVMEDVKQARRYAKEDKLRPTASASEASPEGDDAPQTDYRAEIRRPMLKRKRDEAGDGDIRVRLWGQRLYASIYTSDDRQTFLKDFLLTEDGQVGELESSGLVNVGDRIVGVNGATTTGMASWQVSDAIRNARRPLWLTFARGNGAVPMHRPKATPAPGRDGDQQGGSSALNGTQAPSLTLQSAQPLSAQGSSDSARSVSGSSSTGGVQQHVQTPTGSGGSGAAHASAIQLPSLVVANGQPRPSSPHPRPSSAPPAPLTAPHPRQTLSSSVIGSDRPVEVLQARTAEAAHSSQHYNHQPNNAPAPRSTQAQTRAEAVSSHFAAISAANNKMLQLREALLQRQREQLERHDLMQQQLHRMGPNLPTNGFATPGQQQIVPAPRPATSGQWNSHPHVGSSALVPAASNSIIGAVPVTTDLPMAGAAYPIVIPPPVANPMMTTWVSTAHPQQGWSSVPAQPPYSVVGNHAPSPMHSSQQQVTGPRFEVVNGTADAHPTAHSSTSSPPQATTAAASSLNQSSSSLHALGNIQVSGSSASTPRTSPTKTGSALASSVGPDETGIDMDDDAAAIAALAGTSPSKKASKAADRPTSFLSPATANVDASADSTASSDAPMVEGDNFFVVTIRKPRLYVTLGSLGSHVAVTSFVRDENGEKGEIEESGKVFVGDVIVGVNGVRLGSSMSPSLLAHLVNTTPRPMVMWFERASWDTLVGST